ncbi:unnamed protein product [Sphenostylis stenocarpa]|uniref:Knottins-like domain-containing protein n=1 Tax=Sphenostylis stenocarpa TaxID=92480 RepID=A0AA86S9W0_9FABA|nr:unnamed protein product [Sphenostylis stenocarpa]
MKRNTGILLLFLLVLAADVAVKRAEANICWSKSRTYTSPCYSDEICANYCKADGFDGGDCGGFRRICFCSKPC